jgi:hypothetical protein
MRERLLTFPLVRRLGEALVSRPEVNYFLRVPNRSPHRFDYPYDLRARYGYGRPLHQGLLTQIEACDANYARLLESMASLMPDFLKISFRPTPGIEPAWDNGWLPALDGIAICHFLTSKKSRLYLEVGSGNSTKFAHRARRSHALNVRLVSIDPQPRAEVDGICDEVLRQPLEAADLSLFAQLQRGDVLFIDNSHRSFTNSDVTVFFLDVLPRLAEGVIVGIHDICLPYDYPPSWRYRYYNEQYLLACYLLAERAGMEILLPSYYVAVARPEMLDVFNPIWSLGANRGIQRHGCAFWLETTRRAGA